MCIYVTYVTCRLYSLMYLVFIHTVFRIDFCIRFISVAQPPPACHHCPIVLFRSRCSSKTSLRSPMRSRGTSRQRCQTCSYWGCEQEPVSALLYIHTYIHMYVRTYACIHIHQTPTSPCVCTHAQSMFIQLFVHMKCCV